MSILSKNQECILALNNVINIIDDIYASECSTNEGDLTSSSYYDLISSLIFIKKYLASLEK